MSLVPNCACDHVPCAHTVPVEPDVTERVAGQSVHTEMCRQNIDAYLAFEWDCAAIERAALAPTAGSKRDAELEAAYRDGWHDADQQNLCGIDEDWKWSDTREALLATKERQS